MKASRKLPYLKKSLFASLIELFLIFSVTLPGEIKAQETAMMTFTVANSVPTVGAVTCGNTEISGDKNYVVWCSAPLIDLNGYQDINGCNGTFFKTKTEETENLGDDSVYSNNTCLLFGGSGNTVNCNCSFRIKHPIKKAVEWTGNITGKDHSSSNSATGTIIINHLLVIDSEPPLQSTQITSTNTIHYEWLYNVLERVNILNLADYKGMNWIGE